LSGSIGFIGGTGPEGRGLAARFARAGREVFLGSRTEERGREAAREVTELSGGRALGGTNEAAAAAAVVIVTVPFAGLRDTLSALAHPLAGKIVVSAVVPLQFSKARIAAVPVEEGSAAELAQAVLPGSRVAGAFQNLSAHHLLDLDQDIEGDVVVCSDDGDTTRRVIELAGLIPGVRGIDGGPLANSRYVEELTALLLNINRIHKAETHVRIVGV
jgi:hypothetical protein